MNKQRGMTLVGAIFILVIIGLLGQFLVNISSTQRQTSLLAIQSARAYQAANAGIEWGIAQIVLNDTCSASTLLTLPGSTFDVTVICDHQGSYTEDITVTHIYQLTSKSEYNLFGSADYVSRTITATIQQ